MHMLTRGMNRMQGRVEGVNGANALRAKGHERRRGAVVCW